MLIKTIVVKNILGRLPKTFKQPKRFKRLKPLSNNADSVVIYTLTVKYNTIMGLTKKERPNSERVITSVYLEKHQHSKAKQRVANKEFRGTSSYVRTAIDCYENTRSPGM